IMVLCISSAVAIICWLMRLKNQKMVKMVVTTAFVSVLLGSGYLFYPAIKPFFKSDDLSQTKLPYHTPSGNIYYHNLNNKAVENGHLIWTYICWKELREEWQKKSDIPVDSVGKSGEQIMTTLIRFLTSKADPKDSSGVSKLDERQVVAIENGETNYYLMDEQGVRKRMYQISWEMHSYLMGAGNPEGNSAAQRFEFWKAAVHVLKKHWIIGVGTGDTYDEMKKAYQELESNLSDNYRLKPHNQYLTYWITYGILGFLLLIFIFVRPIFVYKYNYPYLIFAGILLSSMLVEDTIEGQIGLTFATVFYCLFSFASSRNLDSSEHEIPAEV
ncbi:MAG: O-antigen ligase family protein, partial [Flavobacteriales bacterium]|nr:O-antigen ligase family protein [Flavobacteriales bacterium]